MRAHRARGVSVVALTVGLVILGLAFAGRAQALPANPWAGQWLSGSDVITLTQNGAQVSGSGPCPGTTGSGVSYSGTASPDGASASFSYGSTECTGIGGTFTATMSADGLRVTGSGLSQYGTSFDLAWTYQTGGTEPRATPVAAPAVLCPSPGAPWTGRWSLRGGARAPTGLTLVQSGPSVTGQGTGGGPADPALTGSVSPGQGALSHLDATQEGVAWSLDLVDARTLRGRVTVEGRTRPVAGSLTGCPAWPAPAPNLGRTIPDPTTVTAGPTGAVFPGTISLRSLRRSKCVRVVVISRRPARVLATIFSGRRSIRLFGQKDVRFRAPGRRVVCIRVPLRARTFHVRTPLRFALGYRLGAAPPRTRPGRRGPRAARPVIRPIRLVP